MPTPASSTRWRSARPVSAGRSGIGRSGAILAPILIGVLVGMNLPLQQNFIAIAIPAVIGMVAVLMINHGRSASAHREDVSAELPDSPASVSVAGSN